MPNDSARPQRLASPSASDNILLYLDFDGVLHPDDVWHLADGTPQLGEASVGHRLFEHAALLAQVLLGLPHVALVLSTSWVRVYGLAAAVARLPVELQSRVVGATFDPARDGPGFAVTARGYQVLEDVRRRRATRWLALDDEGKDWPDEQRHRLVLTDSVMGIGAPGAIDGLARQLAAL